MSSIGYDEWPSEDSGHRYRSPDREHDHAEAQAEWWANVEPGCYVEGSWGIYATSHLADQFPDVVTDDDADVIEAWLNEDIDIDDDVAEAYHELAYTFEQRIDERLPEGLVGHWWDGEFFVSRWCGRDHEQSSECTDGMCYCHCD